MYRKSDRSCLQLLVVCVKSATESGTSIDTVCRLPTDLGHRSSPVCDSYVRPETLVRICDECNFGTYGGRCIICGSPGTCPYRSPLPCLCHPCGDVHDDDVPTGISDAYYCAECTRLEKDRDGCPKIVNLGASRTDLFYERRRLGA